MNRLILACATGLAALSMALPATAQSVRERQWNQRERIERGYRNGDITNKEYRKLSRQQDRIAYKAHRDRRDGYGMSGKEWTRAQARQNEASRDIRRQRRDGDHYN